ncbi:MAG: hypothetical protein WC423_01400 [Vulcanimicrobiota bacterium]
MSQLKFLRTQLARIQKEIADLGMKASKESDTVTKASKDIARINASITKNTSNSSLRQKESTILRLRTKIDQANKKKSSLEDKRAKKVAEESRILARIEAAEASEQRAQDRDEKARQRKALEHARSVTREMRQQEQIARRTRNLSISDLPEKITVLVLSACPLDQDRLTIDDEMRAIQKQIRASEYRDSINLESRWAVQSGDLLQAMNETGPTIVHLSGHSDPDSFAFSDGAGGTKLISFEVLIGAMAISSDKLQLVVLNSCDSVTAAEKASAYFDFAIGMSDSIDDEAAIVFAGQFYSAIGFAKSVKESFEQAKAQLMLEGLEGADLPQLFHKPDASPDETHLVRPS